MKPSEWPRNDLLVADPILLPEAEVVGGLWDGATVRTTDGQEGTYHALRGADRVVIIRRSHSETSRSGFWEEHRLHGDPVWLVLPGPHLTGAFGLATGLMDRICKVSWATRGIGSVVTVAESYGVPQQVVSRAGSWMNAPFYNFDHRHLAAASSYVALTDRLGELVGNLPDPPQGHVMRWRHESIDRTDRGEDGWVEWLLTDPESLRPHRRFAPHPAQHHGSHDTTYVGALLDMVDPHDPLEALRTCIAHLESTDG